MELQFSSRLRQFLKLIRLLPTAEYRRGLRIAVGASIEHQRLLRNINLSTCIDVGANVGQFSLLMRALHPEAHIYAFEPLARPRSKYSKLLGRDRLTTLYPVAIGAESAADRLMNVAVRDDGSSLLPINEEQTPDSHEMIGTEAVKVVRLDEVLTASDMARPALLKIDVQGYELPVLQGCGALLDAIDYIYVEVAFLPMYEGQALVSEIVEFLTTRGFLIIAVNDPTFDEAGRCIQADFLFGHQIMPTVSTVATSYEPLKVDVRPKTPVHA
jgi:FkbM family methyltransferase